MSPRHIQCAYVGFLEHQLWHRLLILRMCVLAEIEDVQRGHIYGPLSPFDWLSWAASTALCPKRKRLSMGYLAVHFKSRLTASAKDWTDDAFTYLGRCPEAAWTEFGQKPFSEGADDSDSTTERRKMEKTDKCRNKSTLRKVMSRGYVNRAYGTEVMFVFIQFEMFDSANEDLSFDNQIH